MSYTVYKHTSPSGKAYIGITSLSPTKRWQSGRGYRNNPYFNAAIEKYGWGAFKHEILAEGLTKETAERVEVDLIEAHRSTDPRFGYNIDRGGSSGATHSPATCEKIGNANRERVWTPEARAKVGAASRGRPQSEATRKKRSHANRGRVHTDEAKEKIRAAKQKAVVCTDTGRRYPSIAAAASAIGASPSLVSGVCRGVHKTTKGLHFSYCSHEEVIA